MNAFSRNPIHATSPAASPTKSTAPALIVRFLVSTLAALWLLPPVPAAAQEQIPFEQAREEAEARLVPKLEALAGWCHSQRLYRERDRMWSGILAIRPEHRRARRALRYVRMGGEWRQSRAYHEPRNRNPGAMAEFAERLARAMHPFQVEVFDLLQGERGSLRPEIRREVLLGLLALDPDDTEVRGALGEALLEGRWVLMETAATLRGRRHLALLARASLEQAQEPRPVAPTEQERLNVPAGHTTDKVRVLGTVGGQETEQTARVTDAAESYFEQVFRRLQPHRPDFTIYLLRHAGEREGLIERLSQLSPEDELLLRRAAGGWLDRNVLAEWSTDPARRLDGAARQTLGAMLLDAYGIDGRHGWAWEGFGLYLVEHLTGTRKTYFIDRSGYSRPDPRPCGPSSRLPRPTGSRRRGCCSPAIGRRSWNSCSGAT